MAIVGRDAFPNSRGGKNCHNLVAQIEQKSINTQTESIWNAPWPELSVAYRNITEVHFRLVPADWNKLREKNFRVSSKEERQALLKMEPVKSWRHDLPPTARLQAAHGIIHGARRREARFLFSHLQRG